MKKSIINNLYHLLIIIFFSCNTKLFVKKDDVLYRSKGILIFWDRKDLPIYGEQDDLIPDSLIGDIFVFTKFEHIPIGRNEVEKLFFEKKIDNGYFLHLVNDDSHLLRNRRIAAGITISLNRRIDSYLRTNNVFIVPAVITYSKTENFKSYYFESVNKNISLQYNGDNKKINLQPGYFNVTDIDVWPIDRDAPSSPSSP